MRRVHSLLIGLLLVPVGFIMQGYKTAGGGGGDHFRIFVNDKLVVEQFLTMPVKKNNLSLTSFSGSDRMVIHYSHCGKVGTARTISVKDDEGKFLKQWNYPDSKGSGMQLLVKDILQAVKQNGSASLYYSSKELVPGRMLTSVNVNNSKTAKL